MNTTESKGLDYEKGRNTRFSVQLSGSVGATIISSLDSHFRAEKAVAAGFEELGSYKEEREVLGALVARLSGVLPNADEIDKREALLPEIVTLDLSLGDIDRINSVIIYGLKGYESMQQSAPKTIFNLLPVTKEPLQGRRMFALDELNSVFSQVSGMNPSKEYTEFLDEKIKQIKEKGENQ